MRIFIFSWNTASICLSGDLEGKTSGIKADFFMPLMKEIELESPEIVIFGFQEDRYPGSLFHSQLLPQEMPKYGYKLVDKSTMMGVGVTTYKNLYRFDPMVRGLATSIYVKENLYAIAEVDWYYTSVSRGKGGLVFHLTIDQQTVSLSNIHMPFNAYSLIETREKGDPMIRQNELNRSNIYFNEIVSKLMSHHPAIFFGDLNYRSSDPRPATKVVEEIARDCYSPFYDELRQQMSRGNIYPFNEGINNEGPTFLPTCKLIKDRPDLVAINSNAVPDKPENPISRDKRGDLYYNVGKYNQRVPSHPDRILHTNMITCSRYESFDVGNAVKKSDHAPLIGVFRLLNVFDR
jgi:hypothetical protein